MSLEPVPHEEPSVVGTARAVLESPGLYNELTVQLARGLLKLYEQALRDRAWAEDNEDEASHAGSEVARRGERLRSLGADVERTVWDGPGITAR